MARQGGVRSGGARPGKALFHGLVWLGWARRSGVRRGEAEYGTALFRGGARRGRARRGRAGRGKALFHGVAWLGRAGHGWARHFFKARRGEAGRGVARYGWAFSSQREVLVLEQLFSQSEAAKILRVSNVTLGRWIRCGKVRAVKIGRAWRISQRTLDDISQNGMMD